MTNGTYATTPVNGKPTPRTNDPGFQFDLYQAVNRLAGTSYTRNDNLNTRYLANPYLWQTNNTVTVAAIGYSAKKINTLSYYLAGNSANPVSLYGPPSSSFDWAGSGTLSNPYPGAVFTPGTNKFGFSLFAQDYTPAHQDARYYSEYTRNPGGIFKYDHLIVYNMSDLAGAALYLDASDGEFLHTFSASTYLMGWEDKAAVGTPTSILGDEDYNDLMFLVDLGGTNSAASLGIMGPASVPEPGTISLMIAGFAGLWVLGRRNRR
jgi:hypothetical protein